MKNIIYKVPAIHCKHCAHTINMELSELEGVEEVQVDLEQKSVSVSFAPPANEEQIKDLLLEINYPPDA